MTFEVTVTSSGGTPVPMALVTANDEATGKSFSRGTDGNGYANVALFDVPEGTPITLSVVAGGYLNAIQYPTTTAADQTIQIVLAPTFKRVPTRDEACLVRHHFQGLTIHSKTYGDLPWFTAALPAMDAVGELDDTLDQLKAAGDTHCQIDFEFNYGEPGQPWGTPQLVPSRSLTNDLPTYLRIVDRVIQKGFIPIFVTPDGDIPWLHANLARVHAALGTRTRYGGYQFGYDGGWPASWSVDDVKALLPWARGIVGDQTFIALMFGRGPAGNQYFFVEDESDYSKPWMQCLDIIFSTGGPDQLQCPALVNGAQYMLGPALTPHGTCTPEWHGPYLLKPGTPRGPYFWGWDEWYEYEWVRGRVTAETINADRARALSVGLTVVG